MMSRFLSRKTLQIRSYITKSVTGIFPTIKMLHDKWMLCSKSRPVLNTIMDQLHTRFGLLSNLRPFIRLLAQGISMLVLTQFLQKKTKNHLLLLTDSLPTVEDITKEMTKTMLGVVHSAYTDI